MRGRIWSRSETLAAFALYCKLPFGQLNSRNVDIIALAKRLSRTPASIGMKCGNFASLDPTHQNRGVRGLQNASSLDRAIWIEFQNNPEAIAQEAIREFGDPLALIDGLTEELPMFKGRERQNLVNVRVNQNFFRKMILASFNETCAICGVPLPELLVASHIVPWALDDSLRMNPRNGLCLCGTHDRAFETGLLRIDADYRITIVLTKKVDDEVSVVEWLLRYHGEKLRMPLRWIPDPQLLIRKLAIVSNG